MKKVLTIAGSDCSGGAGIQADIKTITVHKLYAMSAVTALTAQNTTGVYGVMPVTPDFLADQLDCIFTDIRPDAVKIGMVSNGELIRVICHKLQQYHAENIVVDPVMISTSGSPLLDSEAMGALRDELLPLAAVVTPNILEAEALCGEKIDSRLGMETAARMIWKTMCKEQGGVLVKGGHLSETADDLLYTEGEKIWYPMERISNPNTHGTGCTLSSALACNLAEGYSLPDSVKNAKAYISGALRAGLDLGRGSGPLNHMYWL